MQNLFDLAFLINDVLPSDWVKLLHFQLLWHRTLVFVGGVEVAGTRR